MNTKWKVTIQAIDPFEGQVAVTLLYYRSKDEKFLEKYVFPEYPGDDKIAEIASKKVISLDRAESSIEAVKEASVGKKLTLVDQVVETPAEEPREESTPIPTHKKVYVRTFTYVGLDGEYSDKVIRIPEDELSSSTSLSQDYGDQYAVENAPEGTTYVGTKDTVEFVEI